MKFKTWFEFINSKIKNILLLSFKYVKNYDALLFDINLFNETSQSRVIIMKITKQGNLKIVQPLINYFTKT